jgi:hypothetical protein
MMNGVRQVAGSLLIAAAVGLVTVSAVAGTEDHVARGHREVSGTVTLKAGALVLQTPEGATHQLNANLSRRHGHDPFKAGDAVVAVLDENNYIIDMH